MAADASRPIWTAETVRAEWPAVLQRLSKYPDLLGLARSAQVVSVDDGELKTVWVEASPEAALQLNDEGEPRRRILEEEIAAVMAAAAGETRLTSFRLRVKSREL